MKTRPLALRRPLLAATLLLAAAALLLAACTTYRWGTDFPRGQRTIALEPVVNLSQEEALSTLLRDTLAERIAQTPGLRLAPPMGEPELRLAVKVLPLDQGKAARARTRKSIASHDDSDSYQTVLYRLTMSCEYTATPADPALPPRSGKVEVTADVPLLQDLALAQRAALPQLARDAAAQILALAAQPEPTPAK